MVELLHKLRTTAAEQEVSFLRHFLDGRILPNLGHEANGAAVVLTTIIFNADDMLISKALQAQESAAFDAGSNSRAYAAHSDQMHCEIPRPLISISTFTRLKGVNLEDAEQQ